jgi:hypothetical protein
LKRQTPGKSGEWNNIRGTLDYESADYHIAVNRTADHLDPERTLMFATEPPFSGYLDDWDETDALAKFHISNHFQPQKWARTGKTYDELKRMDPPEKTRDLSWITGDHGKGLSPLYKWIRKAVMRTGYKKFRRKNLPLLDHPPDGHIIRMEFLDRLTDSYPDLLDLYGRGDFSGDYYHGEIETKWPGLAPYRYSIAVENFEGPYYFSEKISDILLSWGMPIYFGCTNLDEILPPDSYVYVDAEKKCAPKRVKEIVESDLYEENLDAIAEARERILDEYQIWPVVDKRISEL